MKQFTYRSFISLAFFLAFSSCSLQKRLYMQGYHVEWKRSKHFKKNDVAELPKSFSKNQCIETQMYITSNSIEENEKIYLNASAMPSPPLFFSKRIKPATKTITSYNASNQESKTVIKNQLKDKPKKDDDKAIIGFTFMLFGLLLLGLAYAFFTTLGPIIGTTLLLIFGVPGGLIVLFGLILVIVGGIE